LLKRLSQGPDLIENVIVGRLRYQYCRLSFRIAVADHNRDRPNPVRAWIVVEIADVGLRFDAAGIRPSFGIVAAIRKTRPASPSHIACQLNVRGEGGF
jgi:hypothetical protein